MTQEIVSSLREKVLESIERTEHLVSMVPEQLLGWRPPTHSGSLIAMDLGHLLGHILDCLAGFCAALDAAFSFQLGDLAELRSLRVNESCLPIEALKRMKAYTTCIVRGFNCCTDQDLSRKVRTVFVAQGETLLTLLLGNFEHLLNHKYQLFFYLKLAGVQVTSRDLYKWRGAS